MRLFADEQHTLNLTISDNGIGFDQKQLTAAYGLGLTSMRERVAAVRGKIQITSNPGRGTRISIDVPCGGKEVANAAADRATKPR